mgnify:CR=1 FL=1
MLFRSLDAGLSQLHPLTGQHVAQLGQRLLQQLTGVTLLHHKLDAGLLILIDGELDAHLAQSLWLKLDLSLMPFLANHQRHPLGQLGSRLLRIAQMNGGHELGFIAALRRRIAAGLRQLRGNIPGASARMAIRRRQDVKLIGIVSRQLRVTGLGLTPARL